MSHTIVFPNLNFYVDVKPDLFKIGDYYIKWYGALIAIGFLLAFLYALKMCKPMKLNQDKLLDVVIVGIIFGVIGARLYYCIFEPTGYYFENPIEILYIHKGGLAIYGGVIGGLGSAAIMAKIRKISIPAVLDIGSLGFLIGQCLGRWGNFFNVEAFGDYTDNLFAMCVPADAINYSFVTEKMIEKAITTGDVTYYQVHPTFFYESMLCLVGFILLHFFTLKFRRYDGQTFILYILWYGLGRFFIEGTRTDSLVIFETIKVSQLLAFVCVFMAIVFLFMFRKNTVLLGCGNKAVMALNSINDEVLPEEVKEEAEFSTIFGDLGYEEDEDLPFIDNDLAENFEEEAEENEEVLEETEALEKATVSEEEQESLEKDEN